MKHFEDPSFSTESALKELADAEKGGVYRPTPIDLDSSIQGDSYRTLRRVWKAGAALAAMAACVGLLWVLTPIMRPEIQPVSPSLVVSTSSHEDLDWELFQDCFNGPLRRVDDTRCARFDYDEDQDVDLADFSRIQLAFHSSP